jgi:hypothetical protein
MKILCKFANKYGPGSNLVVFWDEEECVVVFTLEDGEVFLKMLPETLWEINVKVTNIQYPPEANALDC